MEKGSERFGEKRSLQKEKMEIEREREREIGVVGEAGNPSERELQV